MSSIFLHPIDIGGSEEIKTEKDSKCKKKKNCVSIYTFFCVWKEIILEIKLSLLLGII